MSIQERVEVSIFKEDVPKKTIISSIMNPRVNNGLGEVLFDLLRDLTLETSQMSYSGPCFLIDNENSSMGKEVHEWKDLSVSLDSCFHLFGGSVYQIHAANDNSRYQHILPGVHDIDVKAVFMAHHLNEEFNSVIVHPFERSSIDELINMGGDILNQRGMLSFILSEMTRIIRNKLESLRPKKFYYRHTSELSQPNEVEVVNAVYTENDDESVLHKEIVNDIFIYKIVDEGSMFKLQLEVTAKMGDLIETDHVFEIVIVPGEQYKGIICNQLQNIGGIFIETKKELFFQNMKSMSNRAFAAEKFKQDGNDYFYKFTIGKCALDVLRVCYLVLTDLDNEFPWVTKPDQFNLFSEFITDERFAYAKRTPIELFIIFLQYVSPCIERSGIKNFNLENSEGLERQSVHMTEILSIFSKFSGPDLERQSKLFGDGIKKTIDNGQDIFKGTGARGSVHSFKQTLQNKRTSKFMESDFDLTTNIHLKDYVVYEEPEEVSALIQNRRSGLYVTINGYTYTIKTKPYVSYSQFNLKLSTNLVGKISHKRLNNEIEKVIAKGETLQKVGNLKQSVLGFLFGGGEEIEHVSDY